MLSATNGREKAGERTSNVRCRSNCSSTSVRRGTGIPAISSLLDKVYVTGKGYFFHFRDDAGHVTGEEGGKFRSVEVAGVEARLSARDMAL